MRPMLHLSCAGMSALILTGLARGGISNCCTGPGPGCDDPGCAAAVCAGDSFCCEVAWDAVCVGEAVSLCGELCVPDAACPDATHDCCTTGGPGCTDLACCELVCAADAFCCESAWDGICIDEAVSLCGERCVPDVTCPAAANDCCTTGGPGCTDLACCELVCAADAFCCDSTWDSFCVIAATAKCGCPSCGECCPPDLNLDDVVNGADLGLLLACWGEALRGCECADLNHDDDVDGADIGLLLAAWGPCQATTVLCICESADHDCCTVGEPGCTDVWCCEIVCAVDPFCCEQCWDAICVAEAHSLCGLECPALPGGGGGGCFGSEAQSPP